MNTVDQVIYLLQELVDDATTPRGVQQKLTASIKILQEQGALPVNISKLMHEIEEITDETNLPSFARTQLFNVAGLLETF